MKKLVLIINGPTLNLLGEREPQIYGSDTLEDVAANCIKIGETLDMQVDHFQSNHEGEIIDKIQLVRKTHAGIIINPAAFSHTSIAIFDALNSYDGKVIEVHISNIHKRESFRHHSHVSLRADGIIVGCGTQGYELALLRLAEVLSR